MSGLTVWDALAATIFLGGWALFSWYADRSPRHKVTLAGHMDAQRRRWMYEMAARDPRMLDALLLSSLAQGASFFASTALLAIGGSIAMMGAVERIVFVAEQLPFTPAQPTSVWELKLLGLVSIFIYAFFKFTWAFRLFGYCAITIGATPPPESESDTEALAQAECAATLNALGALHFNRGVRAFYMALAYMGWFLGPLTFAGSMVLVFAVLYRRQFRSRSQAALARAEAVVSDVGSVANRHDAAARAP